MKPEYCFPVDLDKYVYAFCKCPLPIEYSIKIKRESGKKAYPFKCDICGTSGTVNTSDVDERFRVEWKGERG